MSSMRTDGLVEDERVFRILRIDRLTFAEEPVSGASPVAGGGPFRARLPEGLLTGATRRPTMFFARYAFIVSSYAPECVNTRYIRGVFV